MVIHLCVYFQQCITDGKQLESNDVTSILPFFLFFSFFFFFNHNVITLRQFGRVGYYLHLKKQKFLFFIFFPLFIFVHTISKKKNKGKRERRKEKKSRRHFLLFQFRDELSAVDARRMISFVLLDSCLLLRHQSCTLGESNQPPLSFGI